MFLREVILLRDHWPGVTTYPFSIPAVRDLDHLEFRHNVVFFVGENGSGKSTLLEAMAYKCGFPTGGGSRNNVFDVDASHAALGDYVRLSWRPKLTNGFFLRAETFHHFASHIDALAQDGALSYQSYGGRSLHEQSHGEAFLSLFNHRFGKRGIYLLDEPEAALSPARQLAFLRVMHDLGDDAQFVIATHSPILLGYPNAQIISFDTSPASEARYEDTDHYRITKEFLNHPEAFFHALFRPSEDSPE